MGYVWICMAMDIKVTVLNFPGRDGPGLGKNRPRVDYIQDGGGDAGDS